MNETWPFRAGANDMELANKQPEQSPAKRVCSGRGDATEWTRPGASCQGEGYGVCIDDVTRLVCIFLCNAKKNYCVAAVQPAAINCPPDS